MLYCMCGRRLREPTRRPSQPHCVSALGQSTEPRTSRGIQYIHTDTACLMQVLPHVQWACFLVIPSLFCHRRRLHVLVTPKALIVHTRTLGWPAVLHADLYRAASRSCCKEVTRWKG